MLCTIVAPYPGDLLLHLESFLLLVGHVERRGGAAFERAARDLRVDRSVLRRRVQTLGDWLDVPLLGGRGAELRLTAAGARLAERAERVLASTRQLREDVVQARDRIVVACTGTITTELLPRVLVELEKRPRPVQLSVRRAGGASCESLVRSGEVDLGVVRAIEPPRDLASRHLVDDRLWFVVPSRHPLAARSKVSLAQMAAVPLVLYGPSSRTNARVLDRLGRWGPTVRVEVEGRAAAIAYVRAGVGATFLSLLPGHAVDATRVHARDVTALFGPSRFYVIGRPDRWSDPVVTEVVDHIARAVQ